LRFIEDMQRQLSDRAKPILQAPTEVATETSSWD
jgi:hypothetical protein